jgi:hypothetical protein
MNEDIAVTFTGNKVAELRNLGTCMTTTTMTMMIGIRVRGFSALMHLGLKRNRPFVPQSSFMGARLPY